MPKKIVRAAEVDAIFRQADLYDKFENFLDKSWIMQHQSQPPGPPEPHPDAENAPGASDWEHNHPGRHIMRPRKGLPKGDYSTPDYTTARTYDPYAHFKEWPEDKLRGYHEHLTTSQWSDGEDAQTATAIQNELGRRHQLRMSSVPTPRYVLLPHWDPEESAGIMHDHAADMATSVQPGSSQGMGWAAPGMDDDQLGHAVFRHHSKKWDEPGSKCKYCKAPPTHAILHSEGMAYVQTCDKHLDKGKEAAAACVPYGGSDPSNINSVKKLAAPAITPELMDMARHGGFTLHDHVGDAPTSGYMVSRSKNTEDTMPMNKLTPEHISSYANAHTRELSDPNTYLGGWLDGKNFYLDISSHRPTIDRAAHDAANANQLAIYDLGKGTSINTPDAVNQAGDPGLAYHDRPKNPLMARHEKGDDFHNKHEKGSFSDPKELGFYEDLPSHDWLQHTLGDPDDWDEYDTKNKHEAAGFVDPFASPAPEPPAPPSVGTAHWDPDKVEFVKQHPGSNHGAQVFRNPTTKENWLVKPDPSGALAEVDVAANHIATQSGVETPPTFKTTLQGHPASTQLMYPNAKDAFKKGPINPDSLSDEDLMTIQKHHALDWLLGNHDSHSRQFVRTQDGKLVGIDKGQAFKYYNNDKLHWNFHPNGALYNEDEPIYNTLYRNFALGGRQLNDPRDGELGKYVQGLTSIPDEEFRQTLTPYAQSAASHGWLGKDFGSSGYPEFGKARFKPNDVNGFLDAAVARKNHLIEDMGSLHDRAMAHRMTGEKIAYLLPHIKFAVAPDPALLQNMHQEMGTHGARVYSDGSGQWLIKRPPPGAEFMAPMDHATSALQEHVGLANPETHTLPWHDGSSVTAVRMIPGAKQAFRQPPRSHQLSPQDRGTLQKHQALDWLIGNHDSHVGNFMRTPEGNLVGIDKGQAAKYYGRDRLDYNFHPNFYAREPIYNQLWRDHAAGNGPPMADPRTGELGEFVKRLQDMPDHDLKNMFRPYAQSAAAAGILANPKDDPDTGEIDPRRKLGPPTIGPNDPEEFLEAMAKRKNNLSNDLGTLFDRANNQRLTALSQKNRFDPSPKGPGMTVLTHLVEV